MGRVSLHKLLVAPVKAPHIYGLCHPYKHMITMLYRNFMPIICVIEREHTDFKEGDTVPTKVKLLHMEKTILALCLNADLTADEGGLVCDCCSDAHQCPWR